MAIEAIDVTHIHRLTAAADTAEPKTEFHVRTFTRKQRARAMALFSEISENASCVITDGKKVDFCVMKRVMDLTDELWEMLVVDVRFINADVPKSDGVFGKCVSRLFLETCRLPDAIILDVLKQGIDANMVDSVEKKRPAGLSGLPTGCQSTDANAARIETEELSDAQDPGN